ncbi:MAG: hypothetical protein C0478_16345 [Planctomyces sp.]|nr:hypothetical protein [Planctomyces sp.]
MKQPSIARLPRMLKLVLTRRAGFGVRLALVGAVFTLIAGFGEASAQAQTQLALKFKAGDTYQQKVTTRTISGGEVAGEQVKTTLQQEMLISTKVESLTEEGAGNLSQVIEQITLDIGLPKGKSIAYDSNQKEFSDPILASLHKTLGKLAGARFEFTTTTSGEILNFKMPAALTEMAKNQPGGGMMGDSLSEANLRRMFEDAGVSLPKEPVKKGDSWTRKASVKLPIGEVTSHLVFTYDGPENDTLERIVVSGDVEIAPAEKSPLSVKLNSTKLTGLTFFDRNLGRVDSSSMSQVLNVTVAAGGQTNDLTIESQVEMKIVPPKK